MRTGSGFVALSGLAKRILSIRGNPTAFDKAHCSVKMLVRAFQGTESAANYQQ